MRFKEVLKKYGISQIELAERLGINRVSVSRLLSEKNDMRASTIKKIADAIGCPPGELFEDPQTPFLAVVRDGGDTYTAESADELEEIITKIKEQKNLT